MTHAPMGRAGSVRCKDAGSGDSSVIAATEDAAACVRGASRQPVLVLLRGAYWRYLLFGTHEPPSCLHFASSCLRFGEVGASST